MKLKICHLYPDVLNLYGDGGNIRCLTQRLSWRGIETELKKLPIGAQEGTAGGAELLARRVPGDGGHLRHVPAAGVCHRKCA